MKKLISIILTISVLMSLAIPVVRAEGEPTANANVYIDLDFETAVPDKNKYNMTKYNLDGGDRTSADGEGYYELNNLGKDWMGNGLALDKELVGGIDEIGREYNIYFDFNIDDMSLSAYQAHRLTLGNGTEWNQRQFSLLAAGTSPYKCTNSGKGFYFDGVRMNIDAKEDTWYSYHLKISVQNHDSGRDTKYVHTLNITEIGNPENTMTYVSPVRYNVSDWNSNITYFTRLVTYTQVQNPLASQIYLDNLVITEGEPMPEIEKVEYITDGGMVQQTGIDTTTKAVKITYSKSMNATNLVEAEIVTLKTADDKKVIIENGGWSADAKTYTVLIPENSFDIGTKYIFNVSRDAKSADENITRKKYTNVFVANLPPLSVSGVTFLTQTDEKREYFDTTVKKIKIDFNMEINPESIATGDISFIKKSGRLVAYTGEVSEDKKSYIITLSDNPEIRENYLLKVSGVETEDKNVMTYLYEQNISCVSDINLLNINYDDKLQDALWFDSLEDKTVPEGKVSVLESSDGIISGNYVKINADSKNIGYKLNDAMHDYYNYTLKMKFKYESGDGDTALILTKNTNEQLNDEWFEEDDNSFIVLAQNEDGVIAGNKQDYAKYSGTLNTIKTGNWYQLEMTLKDGKMTSKITDIFDAAKYCEASYDVDYDGLDKLVLKDDYVMCFDDIILTRKIASSVLVYADYDTVTPELKRFNEKISANEQILPGAPDGTNYLEYKPGTYLSHGYSLNETIPLDGGYYDLSFDFRLTKNSGMENNTSDYMYPIMGLTRTPVTDANCYNGFGFFGVNRDNKFMIAGEPLNGIGWESGRWYTYDLVFNRRTFGVDLKITEKEAPYRTAYLKRAVISGEYNYHTTDAMKFWEFDALKFYCNPEIDIDNLILRKSAKKPLSINVTSAHVGNIFDGKDKKELILNLSNNMEEMLGATISYEIYNSEGTVIETGKTEALSFKECEEKDVPIIVKSAKKFGTYKIKLTVTAESASMASPRVYESENYKFSVVNKVSSLNYMTAVNVERMYDMETWYKYKEIVMQAGISGVRADVGWADFIKDGDPQQFKEKGEVASTVWYEDAMNSGIDNLAIINVGHPITGVRPDTSTNDASFTSSQEYLDWKAYVAHIAGTYGDVISLYEMINEPQWKVGSGWVYDVGERFASTYLKDGYDAVKQNDKIGKNEVMGISLAGMADYYMNSALGYMSKNGGIEEYLDIMSFHPYDSSTEGYNQSYVGIPNDMSVYPIGDEMKGTDSASVPWSIMQRDRYWLTKKDILYSFASQYGAPKDIGMQVTEMGLTTTEGVASQRQQAADMVQTFTMSQAGDGYDRVWWFHLEDYHNIGDDDRVDYDGYTLKNHRFAEGGYGLVDNYYNTVPLAAKESYVALCGYNSMIMGATPKANCKYNSFVGNTRATTNTSAYTFENRQSDGKDVLILWSEPADPQGMQYENIAFNLGCDSVKIYDMYSNELGTLVADDGVLNFTAGVEPIYIVGDFTNFEKVNNNITMISGRSHALPGDEVVFRVADTLGRTFKTEVEYCDKLSVNIAEIFESSTIVKVNVLQGADEEEEILVKLYDSDDNLRYVAKHYVNIKKYEMDWIEMYDERYITETNYVNDGYVETRDYNKLNSGEKSRVRVAVENTGDIGHTAKFVVAYYDKSGKLIDTLVKSHVFTKRGKNYIENTFENPPGAVQMKVMLWDAVKPMRPLCDPLYFNCAP